MKIEKLLFIAVLVPVFIISCSDDDPSDPVVAENPTEEVVTEEPETVVEEPDAEVEEPDAEVEEPNAVVEGRDQFIEDLSYLANADESYLFAPDVIPFEAEGLFPEGVEFDFRRNRFYVGSLTRGSIGIVNKQGDYETFIEDDVLTTTTGLHIDNLRDILYVCITSFTGDAAGVAGYDLKTGERVLYVDLLGMISGSPQFPNDLITDFKGNLYVTDSFSNVVYKIDRFGKASIFLQDERLVSSAAFGLNGITYHPFGFLLVATGDDVFFRVPINDPESFTEVPLGIGGGVDGVQITDLTTVLAVSGSQVFRLRSTDLWRTIKADGTYSVTSGGPTTLANSYFNKTYTVNPSLSDLQSVPPRANFSLELVEFE